MTTPDKHGAMPACDFCKGAGLTGWYTLMGRPPNVEFIPEFCQCAAGKSLAKINSPDAKRTIVSSVDIFSEGEK